MQDTYLTGLVNAVNTGASGLRITLLVGGVVVRGELISHKAYREAMAEHITAMARYISPPLEGTTPPPPSSIHLRNASISGATSTLPYWRGLIERVDGFALEPAGDSISV